MNFDGFLGGGYQDRSVKFDAQRCMNLIPMLGGEGAKEVVKLELRPGLHPWLFLSAQGIRGSHVVGNLWFVVSGNKLYKILNNATATVVGTLNTSVGLVGMEHNANNEVAIVDGHSLYLYNFDTDTFNLPSPQPISPPTSICFIDQYFIVTLRDSQAFQISSPNDGTSWNAMDIAAAEANPDLLLAGAALIRQLYLFGEFSTEIWYNSGAAAFPFDPTQGIIDWGLLAKNSVAKLADTLAWLGKSRNGSFGGQAVMAVGYQAKVFSTPALEARWATYQTTQDAFAFSYRMDGSEFYVITFPTGGETFVYDMSTGLWHERSSYNLGYWRVAHYAAFANNHLVTDYTTGWIYTLDNNVFDDNGDPIVWFRRCPHIWNDRKQIAFHSLEVEFETGVEC